MIRRLFSLIAVLAACTGSGADSGAGGAIADSAPAADRSRYTMEQFRVLQFLAGKWKGTMPNGTAFFESYQLVNDSTIQMYAHADSTFGVPTDSSRIYFSDGTIYNGPQAVVDRIDETGVRFTATGPQRYVYVWKSTGPDSWMASLGANGETVYHLTRVQQVP